MNREHFSVIFGMQLAGDSPFPNAAAIVGFVRPVPWAPSFVFPVFSVNGICVTQVISSDHVVIGFTPIAIEENFVRLVQPSPKIDIYGLPAMYAVHLPNKSIVVADRISLQLALSAQVEGIFAYPSFCKELFNLLEIYDPEEWKLNVSPSSVKFNKLEAVSLVLTDLAEPMTLSKLTSEKLIWFGTAQKLSIGLRVLSLNEIYLRFIIAGFPLVNDSGSIESRIEMLSFINFFAENWDAIQLETFPQNVKASNVSDWWHKTHSKKIQYNPSGKEIESFNSRHCLSIQLGGAECGTTEKIWFISQQNDILVEVPKKGIACTLLINEWREAVEGLCEQLVHIIKTQEIRTSEMLFTIDQWEARERPRPKNKLLGLYTGISDEKIITQLTRSFSANDPIYFQFHNSEILAVARMRPEGLNNEDLQLLFNKIESSPHCPSNALDKLSRDLFLDVPVYRYGQMPFNDGQMAANWLRNKIGNPRRVNPGELLKDWGVIVGSVELSSNKIDAIGYWGPHHGPGIIVNKSGIHAKSNNGRRATLAHEICHLLIDRKGALPLGEVLNGRINEDVEARARAFAAELLLPHIIAYETILATDKSIHEISRAIPAMVQEFGCSVFVVGYQCKKGLLNLSLNPDSEWVRSAIHYIDNLVDTSGGFRDYIQY